MKTDEEIDEMITNAIKQGEEKSTRAINRAKKIIKITLKFTHRFHILWDTDIPIFEAALRELKDEGWKP